MSVTPVQQVEHESDEEKKISKGKNNLSVAQIQRTEEESDEELKAFKRPVPLLRLRVDSIDENSLELGSACLNKEVVEFME